MIKIQNLRRKFRRKVALDGINLEVPRGCVFGLVGENGAGKTTLIKHILGLFKAQQGSVRVFGLDPVRDPVSVLGRIGYLSEDRDLPDWMRIGHLLRYQAAFYAGWDEAFADTLVQQFELDLNQRIKQLSRGQRARVGLLIALAHRPDLLVLDEPSSGLDPIVRRDILGAIIRTVVGEGRTVLFSSHLLEEVQRVADDVAMIHQGRLVISGHLQSIIQQYRRVVIRFDDDEDKSMPLSGAMTWHGQNREWTAVCNGQLALLKDAAERANGSVVEDDPATLTDVFMAHVESRAKTRSLGRVGE